MFSSRTHAACFVKVCVACGEQIGRTVYSNLLRKLRTGVIVRGKLKRYYNNGEPVKYCASNLRRDDQLTIRISQSQISCRSSQKS
jgi:hypothetical protein